MHWRYGVAETRWFRSRSCSPSSTVSTWMGDSLGA